MIRTIYLFIFVNLILFPHQALSDQSRDIPGASSVSATLADKENPALKECGVLMSYGATEVVDQNDYVTIPLLFRFGIDCDKYGLGYSGWIERGAKDFFHKDFRPAGTTELLLEPFVA